MTGTFNPSRLRFARSREGLNRAALAREVAVSARTIANYEDGFSAPSNETVKRLGEVLHVPAPFFYAEDLAELSPEAVSFRALSKMPATRRDSAMSSGVLAIQLSRWLDERLDLPAADLPRYERPLDAATAAERVRLEWEMGYTKIRNTVHLLEAHGVRVFSLPEHLTDVDAFSFWWQGTPYVILNTRKSAERGRFDAMHEFGHLVMHADYDLPQTRERELQANRFASAMLMPSDDVLSSGLRGAGVEQVLEARHRWGVSAMALTQRLHELGLTSDWIYISTCRRLSQLGYRREEHDGIGTRETSQVLDKAFRLLREHGITQAHVASELKVHSWTLRELLFGLLMTPLAGDAQGGDRRTRPDLALHEGGG